MLTSIIGSHIPAYSQSMSRIPPSARNRKLSQTLSIWERVRGRFRLSSRSSSVRSSVNAEKEGLITKLKELADFYNGTYSQSGTYPAWEFKKDSRLRDVMVPIYTRMFGKEPKVLAIHAGLECGLLGDKLPGLDCVSIGPQMHDIHTSREKLEIASTKRTWDFLLEVLKAL